MPNQSKTRPPTPSLKLKQLQSRPNSRAGRPPPRRRLRRLDRNHAHHSQQPAEQRPTTRALPGRRLPLRPTRPRGQRGRPTTPCEAACPRSAPAVPAQPTRSTRSASRAAALADAPVPDLISSPGLVREQKPRPVGGFRGALYNLTGGGLNLGPSARQREEDELARRISRQLQGSYNTAVLSLKGGIGKTSTTVGVGLTLAEFPGILRARSTPTPIPAIRGARPRRGHLPAAEPAHHHGSAQEHRLR